jgi:hypothetical protein
MDCEELLYDVMAFLLPKTLLFQASLVPGFPGLPQVYIIVAYEAEMKARARKEIRLVTENIYLKYLGKGCR